MIDLKKEIKPTRAKYVVYLFLSTGAGILISFWAHSGIEIILLKSAMASGKDVVWYGGCALHPAIQISLLVFGAFGGLSLGRYWWRKVYNRTEITEISDLPKK